ALEHLDKDYTQHLFAFDFTKDSPARDVLEPDNEIISVNGTKITGHGQLVNTTQQAQGDPLDITVGRDGTEKTFTIPVTQGVVASCRIWVLFVSELDIPIHVDIYLEDVAGPPAGLLFPLAIIDRMTEKSIARRP